MSSETLTPTLRETLKLFDGGGEPRTTTEVADALDLGRRSTYDRLDRLVDAGRLQTKKVGSKARVWWRSSDAGTDVDADPDPPAAAASLVDDVLNDVEVSVFVLDENFDVAWINAATERYFGLDRETAVGGDKRHLVMEEIRPKIDDGETYAETVLATYEDNTDTERFECRVTQGEGREERWLEHRSEPIESGAYAGGRVELYYDVSDRKRTENARTTDREEFQSLVEAVEEYAIFTLDEEGYIRTWNPGAARIKGYDADDIVGEHFSTFYTEADRELRVPERNLAEAARSGSVEDEGWRVRADGSRFWANVTITAIRDDDGEITGYAKVTRDMTDRREYEERLREERNLLQRVFDAVPVSVGFVSPDGTFTRANARATEWLGTGGPDGESYLLDARDVYDEHGEYVPVEERPYVRVFETGEPVEDWHCQIDLPDYGRRWLSINAVPLTDDDGEVEEVIVVGDDVTQLKEQAARLQRRRDELETELEAVFERVDDAFYALDDEWRFTHVNDRAADLFGVDPAALVGQNVWEVLDVPDGTPIRERFLTAMATQESTTFEQYSEPLGIWELVRVYPSESGLSVYFRDVTERKERERELERYETLVETVDDGVYALDPDGNFVMVNDAFSEMTGYEREELLGEPGTVVTGEEVRAAAAEEAEQVATGEQDGATLEFDLVTKSGETLPVESRFGPYPYDGDRYSRCGVVRDVSERKERERELERYETIVETMEDGVYVLDEDFRFAKVNRAYTEMTGYDREELIGSHCSLVVDEETTSESAAQLESIIAEEVDSGSIEADILRPDGTRLRAESRFTALSTDGGVHQKIGVVRDVSERVARERELEESRRRYRTLVENFPNGAVALVDHDLRYVTLGGTFSGDFETASEEIEGTKLPDALPSDLAEVVRPGYEAALDGEAVEFERTVDGRDYQYQFVPVRDDDGEVFAAMGMSQDITERKEYERSLRDAKSQLEAATEAGAVGTWEWHVSEDRIVTGPSFAETFGVDVAAAHDGISLDQFIESLHEDDRERVEREIEAALDSCGECECEYRVWDADGDLRWVDARGRVECDDDGNPVTFPGALTDITERKQAELELERRREQLEALNHLSEVAREITGAVIDQSTREEIEASVCEHLADSDSYSFAWIGDVDATDQSVNVRTEAGSEGYLDDVDISVDPDDERSRGPTGQAFLTGEAQVVNDVPHDDAHDPWREHVEARDFSSSAAIPIVHDKTVYGVLNVYSERPYAFESSEREVVGQLGEIVGHAIAATERKRALMSDELVELEFQIQDILGSLDAPLETDGRLSLDDTVPLSEDEFLVYGTATPDAVDTLTGLVDVLPHWESVAVQSDGDPITFELTLSDPPVLSAVASLGGYVDDAAIEAGDYRMTIHLAPTVDVRTVIDAVQEAYPDAEMLRRRQITRSDDDAQTLEHALTADLTDRQRTTLEAAYHAGFFEWPRDASGEDVADSIGIAAPTFHQHLRKAEQKVFDAVFSASG